MNTVKTDRTATSWFRARVGMRGVALMVAGCGFVPEILPTPTCDPTEFGQPPALTCDVAVRAAVGALPERHGRIVAVEFHYCGLCPPNARCLASTSGQGTVIVTYDGGDRVSIFVAVQAGRVSAQPPEVYPPPGWEL